MTVNASPATPAPDASQPGPGRRRSPRFTFGSALLTYLLIAVAALLPVPYMLQLPGPVFNTLGEYENAPMVKISGAKTYPTDGRIDMLTVAVSGGPGRDIFSSQVLGAILGKKETVVPSEAYYPLDTTRDQVSAANAQEMTSSQDVAVAAALTQLGKDYSVSLRVHDVLPGSPAEGRLRSGDRIVAVNGKKLGDDPDAATTLSNTVSGSATVKLLIDRAGTRSEIELTPEPGETGKRIGITMVQNFDFPIDVSFSTDGIGGPSAGTMFALAIIDELTPGAMTGGQHVAGTGEISPSGVVSPIGGARQKVAAATAEGATLFLSPADNCAEVMAAADLSQITVARIDTLDAAQTAVEHYAAGDTSDLPKCPAPNEKGQQ